VSLPDAPGGFPDEIIMQNVLKHLLMLELTIIMACEVIMAVVIGNTLKSIAKGVSSVLNGSLDQHGYQSFRKALPKVCMYLFTLIYAIMTIIRIIYPVHKVPMKYTWVELLINYQGGFIRRGLLGEILFRLQPVIPSVVVAGILIFCCYCLFTYLVLKLLSDDTPLIVFLFFVFSPGGFLFPVYEPTVFGRKEVFFFLAFALAIFIYINLSDNRVKVCSFLALYTISTLIHEGAIFFAPLAGCLLVFSISEHKKHLRLKVLCPLLFYVFALTLFLVFSVDRNYDTSYIIKSWSPYFPNIDAESALSYLSHGFDTLRIVRHKVVNFNQFTGPFLIDLCLAFLPIILLLIHTNHLEFFRTLRKNEPIFFLFTIASLLAPFVLFIFAVDWGRVIYFISMHTFIFLIALNSFGLVKYKAMPPITSYQWKIQNVFFLYYTLLWRMPHLR
jgi:hypothetical protein